MPTFRSVSAELRVSLTPENYGLGESWEKYYDQQGIEQTRKVPFGAIKFHDGVVEVNEATAKMLRKHPSFQKRADALGRTDFWEDNPADMQALAELRSAPRAEPPKDGLGADDLERLGQLIRASKTVTPINAQKVIDLLEWGRARFNVIGVDFPTAETRPAVIRADVVKFLDLLEKHGITLDDEPEPVNTGKGAGADARPVA